MRVKTLDDYVELGDWTIVNNIYCMRTDGTAFGNAAGFLISNKAPRFFGSKFKFLIDEWYSFNSVLPSSNDKAKEMIDNFLSFFE